MPALIHISPPWPQSVFCIVPVMVIKPQMIISVTMSDVSSA